MSVLKLEVTNRRDLRITHKEDGRVCDVTLNTDNLSVKSALLECGFRQPDHMLNPTQKEMLDAQDKRDGFTTPERLAGYSVNDRRASSIGERLCENAREAHQETPDVATCLVGWRGPAGFKLVKARDGHSCVCCGKRIPASSRNADVASWNTLKERPTDDHQCHWAHPKCLYLLGQKLLRANNDPRDAQGHPFSIPKGLSFSTTDAKVLRTDATFARLQGVLRDTLGREGANTRIIETFLRDTVRELRTLAGDI